MASRFENLTVVLATTNAHKVEEISRILGSVCPGWRCVPRPDNVEDVDEVDTTLEGNASLKAQALCAGTAMAALSDDSGLFVHALGGAPGVRSARFAGPGASDLDNRNALRRSLQEAGCDGGTVAAEFRCAVALAFPSEPSGLAQVTVTGRVPGTIGQFDRGRGGFGYDPMFLPDGGGGRTFAEMDPAEKDRWSHRQRALLALAASVRAL